VLVPDTWGSAAGGVTTDVVELDVDVDVDDVDVLVVEAGVAVMDVVDSGLVSRMCPREG